MYIEVSEVLKTLSSPKAWIRAIKARKGVVVQLVGVDEAFLWAGEKMGRTTCGRVHANTSSTMQRFVFGASQGRSRERCLATGREREDGRVVADVDSRAK